MSKKLKQDIICGDNLEMMKAIPDETVDLCYIDPPFFTNRNYEVIWNDGAEIRQFEDRFGDSKKGEDGKERMVKDIQKYLEWMKPRIKEIYRILKSTGSFYLHCDYHADAYLRVICDEIFNREPLNRICWKRTNAKGKAINKFNINHDVILFYTKTDKYVFNIQLEKSDILPNGSKKDEKGWYVTQPLIVKKRDSDDKTRIINGDPITLDDDHSWYATQEAIDKYEGIEITSNGIPRYKKYVLSDKQIDDVWDGMYLHPSAKERLGYPTQKPESLLERIIKASSNEGDIVLDTFCGCGTTLAVAKKLNRQFIGIDVSPTACRLISWRLFGSGIPYEKWTRTSKYVQNYPLTKEEILDLNGMEFQNWVSQWMQIKEGKSGADGGLDGMFFGIPVQVKKFQIGRPVLDTFLGLMTRLKVTEGILVGTEFSANLPAEIRKLKNDGIIIHYYTFEDIIKKKFRECTDKMNFAIQQTIGDIKK